MADSRIPILKEFEDRQRKKFTLAFVHDRNRVLLGLKKRGFGMGLWNGFGGKVEDSETIPNAASREIEEECGLTVKPEDLKQIGVILFEFTSNPIIMEVHIFRTDVYAGEVKETEEMRPEWFMDHELPHSKMWPDDELWYPIYMSGKKFSGYFLFRGETEIISFTIRDPVNEEVLLEKPCDS